MTFETIATPLDQDFGAARQGDRAAFSRLVMLTQRMVTSVALAVTADVQLSEDIAQETFLAAWQRLGLMRNAASFLPWLRQVARNRAIDHLRSARYRERTDGHWDELAAQVVDGSGPAETLGAREYSQILARALDEVPDASREVLLLFYREGESTRQVAELLGLSEAAVRKRLQRARSSLHTQVLHRLGEAARGSAPGAAFTALVGAGVAMQSVPAAAAAAAGVTAKTALAFSPKLLLGAFLSVLASVGLVVGAVYWEIRLSLRRLRDPRDRQAMRRNGFVYAALMATYMLLLHQANASDWAPWQLMVAAVGFSAAILALAWRRERLLAKQRRG